MEQTKTKKWISAGICILLGVIVAQQCLGLLMINRTLERARDPDAQIDPTWSVQLATGGIEAIRNRIAGTPVQSGRLAWPKAFRRLFILEICGMAILSLALFQLAASFIAQRAEWWVSGGRFLIGGVVLILLAICGLKLVALSEPPPEPSEMRPAIHDFSQSRPGAGRESATGAGRLRS